MTEYTEAELAPYMKALGPFESFEFAGTFTLPAWRELAWVLKSESRSLDHAKRIVRAFMSSPRLDEKGFSKTSIPSGPELMFFARGVPVVDTEGAGLPEPCGDCAPYHGRYRIVTRGTYEGAARCTCARGSALAAMDEARAGVA
jgi:hypothetical protein